MIWNKKKISPGAVKQMAQNYDMDNLSASVLLRRGIEKPEDLCFFLEKDLRFMHNPFLFKEMEILIDRIKVAAEEKEIILIFGDRDVDGITSTVMMMEALREWGLIPQWRVPQGDEPYGLTEEAVKDFAEQDGSLIITVDNGITCHHEIEVAASLGIDVIVLDHHEPQQESRPPALVVINPKLQDCGYPFRDLAGCGVCSRVIWALNFSRSEIYNQSFILLHSLKVDDDVILQAQLLCNLLPGQFMEIRASQGDSGRQAMAQFLQGQPLVVYEAASVLQALKDFFGPHSEISLQELAPQLAELSPTFRGKTLGELEQRSRSRLYRRDNQVMDTLVSLFITQLFHRENTLFQGWLKSMDLAALGSIADMMPLKNENRILVRRGLEQLNRSERKAIQEIRIRQKLLGKPINAKVVSWYISPWINSAGRMKQAHKAVAYLLEEEDSTLQGLAEEISQLNQQRRELGEKSWKDHIQEAEDSKEALHQKMVMVTADNIPRGITGILATRYYQYFHLPAMIISRQGDSLSGSIRGPKGFPIQDFLSELSPLLDDWGGHEFAGGFALSLPNYEAMRRKARGFLQHWEMQEVEEVLNIDAELPHSFLNEELFELVQRFAPYGEDFPPLLFCAKGLLVEKVELVGRDSSHVKLLLKTDDNIRWPCMIWNGVDRYKKDFSLNDHVDLLFHLEENYFRSQRTLQMVLRDIKRS
ncbi:MAG: single-stranded-DNA-specific exonuclease RecJ [Spirochaetaceae bacterium]|jgi:single-stranded-DNA-specific exonuclease|nr:single-stranded-DNA-specific exonuclease RecJ [Spirochaetaceae bacterium]